MKNQNLIAAFFLLSQLVAACGEWSDHYDDSVAGGADLNIMQLLERDSHTQAFAALVRQAGYGDLLSSSQSFTVFAPSAEAVASMATADATTLRRMVSNHIARYVYPTSTTSAKGVRMLNGKIYHFDGPAVFGGSDISLGDEQAMNGVVHRVSGQIPYASNIYEYMENNPNTSDVYSFIHSFDEVMFDVDASTEIDVDELGRPVYDSVFVSYNRLLEDKVYGLGAIAKEDSVYTMIVPDNDAWAAAYERIAPSFKAYSADAAVADSVQDIRTRLAIVEDLIYRGSMDGLDKVVSTNGSVVSSPSDLTAGTTRVQASNGTVLAAPVLNYDRSETWNKPIVVEAEQQNGRQYNNTTTAVYSRNVTADSQVDGVSGDAYIEVLSLFTSRVPTVIFDIPNTLAGRYDVYAVFLPATVEGAAAETDSTRISFTVTYMNDRGRTSSKSNKAKTLLTNGTKMTKMLAFEGLELPVSNTTDRLWLMDDANDAGTLPVTTQLTITTNVTPKEFSSKELTQVFRLDCIIFEPATK